MARAFRVTGYPRTYVIDAEGKVRKIFTGKVSRERLEAALGPARAGLLPGDRDGDPRTTLPHLRHVPAPRAENGAWPFCSDRCRLADLGRWLGEAYRIPGERIGDGAAARSEGDEEDLT